MRSLRAWCLWYDARTRSRPRYRVGARCDYRAIRQMRQGCHHHRLSLRAAVHGYVSGWPGRPSPRRGGSPPQRRGAVSPTPAAIGAGAGCSRRGRNSVGLSHFLANRRRGFILAFRQRAEHPHHLLRRVVPPGLLDDRPLLRGIVEALEIFLQLDRVHLRHRITFLHRGTTHQERHHQAGTHPGISQHTNRRTRRAPMAGHAACSDGGAARRCRAGGLIAPERAAPPGANLVPHRILFLIAGLGGGGVLGAKWRFRNRVIMPLLVLGRLCHRIGPGCFRHTPLPSRTSSHNRAEHL